MKPYSHYQDVRAEVSPVLKAFADSTYTEDRGYSYAYLAGYYESMICELLADVPKRRRQEIIRQLKDATKPWQNLLISPRCMRS